jgi:hypothetical protein
MALEKELETYHSKLADLLLEQGKFVLICGDSMEGIFGAYEDALAAGYTRCGMRPFLVKKILAVEKVHFFSGPLGVCHT